MRHELNLSKAYVILRMDISILIRWNWTKGVNEEKGEKGVGHPVVQAKVQGVREERFFCLVPDTVFSFFAFGIDFIFFFC